MPISRYLTSVVIIGCEAELPVLLLMTWIGAPSVALAQSNAVRRACGALRGREDAIQGRERACLESADPLATAERWTGPALRAATS